MSSFTTEWTCASCGTPNAADASTCAQCGATRANEPLFASQAAPDAGGSQAAGASPAATTTMAAPGFEPIVPVGVGDLAEGVLGGLVAAVVASAVWYAVVAFSGWQIGLVAIAVGWLVGQGVVFGAGGRASVPLVAVSVAFTFLALAVSEYLIVWHFVNEALGAAAGTSLLQPPDIIFEIVWASLSDDPLTLVFWGIAVFEAVVIPMRSIGRPA